MRVVIDTNILVSACWKPDGLEARVTNLAIAGEIAACVSPEVLSEYRDVLSRRKLASVAARAHEILAALERTAIHMESRSRVTICMDDDDNRFLECSQAANAEYLITGNLRHYPARHGNVRIVNARTFLAEAPLDAKVVL